jgi:hypothetical protein
MGRYWVGRLPIGALPPSTGRSNLAGFDVLLQQSLGLTSLLRLIPATHEHSLKPYLHPGNHWLTAIVPIKVDFFKHYLLPFEQAGI